MFFINDCIIEKVELLCKSLNVLFYYACVLMFVPCCTYRTEWTFMEIYVTCGHSWKSMLHELLVQVKLHHRVYALFVCTET